MKELKYIEKIRGEESLLSLPQSLSEVLTLVGIGDYSMDDLANVIMQDPGLTSKVLKMANSSFYSHRSQISSVHQATVILGGHQVKCLALSASVFRASLLETKYHIDVKSLFSHFISNALGSKMLAEEIGSKNPEEAFTAGLLHDIGLVYLIHHFPNDYKAVIDKANRYHSLDRAEQEILGIDHATLGQMLAKRWNFPEHLCQAIGDHHKKPGDLADPEIVNCVKLSALVNQPVFETDADSLELRISDMSALAAMMKIDRVRIDEIAQKILGETISVAGYMGIDIGDPIEVVARANRELFNSYITIENLFRERQELSQRIILDERKTAMIDSKNMAIATLSHYLNNTTMAISGRAQMLKMLADKGDIVDKKDRLGSIVKVLESSVKKIMAVLQELRELTNLEEMSKYSESNALNFDDRIKRRMEKMDMADDMVIKEQETVK